MRKSYPAWWRNEVDDNDDNFDNYNHMPSSYKNALFQSLDKYPKHQQQQCIISATTNDYHNDIDDNNDNMFGIYVCNNNIFSSHGRMIIKK